MVADVGGKGALTFGTAKKPADLETATAGEGNLRGDVGRRRLSKGRADSYPEGTAQITPTVRTLANMGLAI